MRILICALLITISGHQYVSANGVVDRSLEFEGTVLKIGPNPGYLSGVNPAYQLVKYRVDRVISGKYKGKEIVVDHLLMDGKELNGVKVGDKVCISASIKSNSEIFLRTNAKGLREASQSVRTFYVAGKVTPKDE